MDLNKYTHTSKSEILHTNGYAQAANGSRMGAASTTGFGARLQIAKQRKIIAGYRESRMGQQYGALRAKTYTPSSQGSAPRVTGIDRQANNAAQSAPKFVEPPARTFNKYA